MESFQPGLSFTPISRAEISARPIKDKMLLKHSKRLHDRNFGPGWVSARVEVQATRAEKISSRLTGWESSCIIDGTFQPGLKKQRGFISVCSIFKCITTVLQKSNIDMNHILNSSKKRNSSILELDRFSPGWDFAPVCRTDILTHPRLKFAM